MKKLLVVHQQHLAHIIVAKLESHDIGAVLRGSREYSTVVVGGDSGHWEIMVPEDQFEKAQVILGETNEEKRQYWSVIVVGLNALLILGIGYAVFFYVNSELVQGLYHFYMDLLNQ